MKKNFLTSVAFALTLGLVACGDDGSSNSVTNGEKGEVITLADGSGEKVCDDKLDGWVAEAVGKDFRRCQNGEWIKITANEASAEDEIIGGVTVLQSSSSETIPGSSSSVTLSSSSSVIPDPDRGSSSSSEIPGQAGNDIESSSSVLTLSSSSVPIEDPGSSSSSVITSEAKQSSSSIASSCSVVSSSSVESSSSVVSSSSSSSVLIEDLSSSSVASSSSAKSSSSVASSSSVKSSSSVVVVKGSMTDSRDGQVYKTVTIGTQTWMAENLNYRYVGVKHNYNGYTSDSTSWCYENEASNCDKYGRLYTWSAVMDSAAQFSVNAGTQCGYGKTCTPNSPHRGICPEGWHVPTNEEYSTLYTYIGGSSTAGSLLKSTSGWYSGGNGSDKYGVSVFPAGYRNYNGGFYYESDDADLWSASEYSSKGAWYQYFRYNYDDARQRNHDKYNGQSLRCLKD